MTQRNAVMLLAGLTGAMVWACGSVTAEKAADRVFTNAKVVGKLADFVVLEANPLEVDPLQIEEIDVLLTMRDGKIVHQVEAADADVLDPNEPHVRTGDFEAVP